LPNILDATEEQKSTGMCWKSEDELYNNGTPFKIALRDKRGIMVTILAGKSAFVLFYVNSCV